MMALADRVSMQVERADFDDLVTLVIQAPTWDKDRIQGARILLRAIGEAKAAALELPLEVGAALLASAEGYTPRATQLIERARERLGTLSEVAYALAENLPPPKAPTGRRRRRRRKRRGQQQGSVEVAAAQDGSAPREAPKRRRRRRKPAEAGGSKPAPEPAGAVET